MNSIQQLVRPNIREMQPYKSAREDFYGEANIWLDANENPFETALNRYPDPYQKELKQAIATLKKVSLDQIFIGNGSDEAIDLLFRAFCEPKVDKAYIFQPTYGMYEVAANINNVDVVRMKLDRNFELPSLNEIKNQILGKGLLFICSPNNPTGNVFSLDVIQEIAFNFFGIVVVDEAYIDFSDSESAVALLQHTPNLVVLQTLSKAYGLAGARLGMAFANPEIIAVLNKIKPPYNVSSLSQNAGLIAINNASQLEAQLAKLKSQRDKLHKALEAIKFVQKVYKSDGNFILATFDDAKAIYFFLRKNGIVIRDRTREIPGGLRITVGTSEENQKLIATLNEFNK